MLCFRFYSVLLVGCALAGCSKQGNVSDFMPPEDAAKSALTKVLDAWKSGQAFGPVSDGEAKIGVDDLNWKAGKKLTAYEIVGPTTGEDQNKRFTVKITLEGAAAPQEAVYVIFGKPTALSVYNQIDYKRFESYGMTHCGLRIADCGLIFCPFRPFRPFGPLCPS